ncbi:MAG: RNase J family beta-CASP ribonuclease [archaeon]
MDICTVGGYAEVGKNMTVVKVNDDAVVMDMGFFLPKLIDFEEEGGDRKNTTPESLIKIGAIPNDRMIDSWRKNVRAIVLGHCHLDHIGAAPFLAHKYNCPIIGTPYTTEVLRNMVRDDGLVMKNELKPLNPNSTMRVAKNVDIELINMTHSTPQTAMIAVHTKEGTILYANDFKFDNHPIVGKKPNLKRLKQLGDNGVKALIVDSLYAADDRKTPSEKVAREMLKDVLLGTSNENNAVITTTFASHIARLKSIYDFGVELDRKVVFLGRSMMKYILAAEKLNLVKFQKAQVVGYANKVKKKLKEIEREGRSDYLIVCTGSQGEPGSVLSRMTTNQLPFEFMTDDHVVFSCKTIPVPINQANRAMLEGRLKKRKVRIFSDIHVSGHAGREDLRDLIKITKPEHIIPAHGNISMLTALGELATEMDYELGRNVHIRGDGQVLNIR